MQGKHYHVMKEVRVPRGTILHCSEKQSDRHSSDLMAKGPWGWFEVKREIAFQRGESLCFLDKPSAITLQALEPWRDWPDRQPSSLETEADSYYTTGCVTFLAGTVLRLSPEEIQGRSHSLKPLHDHWFETTQEMGVKAGVCMQFRETPIRYLHYLQRNTRAQPSLPVVENERPLTEVEGLSYPQQRAWEALQSNEALTMKAYQALCPDVNRRSLQRHLQAMVARGLIQAEGKRMSRHYRRVPGTSPKLQPMRSPVSTAQ